MSTVPSPAGARSANEIWGGPSRWRAAGERAADVVRALADGYDRTIAFAHDIVFASLLPALAQGRADSRIQALWVPHSTARIHRYGDFDDAREGIERETAAAITQTAGAFAGAVGGFMAEHLTAAYGIPDHKVILFRNGIVRSAAAYPHLSLSESSAVLGKAGVPVDRPLVLFFGRCIPHKGADIMLEGFGQQDTQAHLLFIAPIETGTSEYVAAAAAKLAELGGRATGIFRFDPVLPFAAMSHPATVAVVVPSRADPCPLTVMEAKLYAGDRAFIIISTGVDGLVEQIVPGGTWVIGSDASELGRAIERAVTTPEGDRRLMAAAAHRSLQGWEFASNHAEGLAALWKGSAKSPRGGRR